MQQDPIHIDLKNFQVCPWCLRTLPVLLLQGYLLFLFARELIRQKGCYDQLDKVIFVLSVLVVFNSLFSTIFLGMAISSCSYVLKVLWSLTLLLLSMRFVFRQYLCSKIYLIYVLSLLFGYFLSIFFLRIIPVRYSLLLIYISIAVCCFHQILTIRDILSQESSRKNKVNKFLQKKKTKQIEMELLGAQKTEEVPLKTLSTVFKYHIKLRKSFCSAFLVVLGVNYFFCWDVEQSRNSLGQFFVVVIVELLPSVVYFMFTAGNQWIIEKLIQKDEQARSSMRQSRKRKQDGSNEWLYEVQGYKHR